MTHKQDVNLRELLINLDATSATQQTNNHNYINNNNQNRNENNNTHYHRNKMNNNNKHPKNDKNVDICQKSSSLSATFN